MASPGWWTRCARRWPIPKAAQGQDGAAWVLGFGIDPSLMRDWTEPDLDWFAQFGDKHPIFLMNASGHIGYANAPALAKAGISPECKGVLVEEQVLQMMPALPAPSPAALLASIGQVLHQAAAMGNTTLFDAGLGSSKGLLEVILLELVAQTALNPVRIAAALFANETRQMDEWTRLFRPPRRRGGQAFQHQGAETGVGWFQPGLTGYQSEAYKCYPQHQVPNVPATGLFNFRPPSTFAPHLLQAVEHGWPAMVHANGDKAIDEVLQAYEHALNHPSAPPRPDCVGKRLRHRIEHASLLTDEHISQMAQLQLSPSFLIGHVGYWGHAFQQTILGDARAAAPLPVRQARRPARQPAFRPLRHSLGRPAHDGAGDLPRNGSGAGTGRSQAGAEPGGAALLAQRAARGNAGRGLAVPYAPSGGLAGAGQAGAPGGAGAYPHPALSNLRDIAVLQTWRSGAPVHLHAKLGCATETAPPA